MIEGTRVKPELAATVGQWEYVNCHCVVALGHGVSFTYECMACGNSNLRFIHSLKNINTNEGIDVGIECARVLMRGSKVPRLAENETKRKERWRREVFRRPGRCITDIDDLIDRGKL